MFLIEKFISLSLLSPLPIIIILLFVGVGNLFKKRKKSGLVLILISTFLYLASSEVFIDKKLYDLENSYSIISEKNLEKGEVYVLLGGGIITTTGEGNIPGIMPAVRIMKTAEYYKKYPKKIYISGGSPLQNQESESSVYARELISLGVNSEDIIVEENSKNTNENALFIKQELEKNGIKNIILITSAFHMKRSMFIFEKNLDGVEIIPAPCNFLEKELLDLNFVRTEWWLGWKYIYNPKNLNQTLNFKEMNKELALLLNNDDELENLISKIEKEIIEKLEILFEE